MNSLHCCLIGAPVEAGTHLPGCLMGPDAYRSAGLSHSISALGHKVTDFGNVKITKSPERKHENASVHHLAEIANWATTLRDTAYEQAKACDLPIFLGGDHSLALGTVAGMAKYTAENDRPQFVLWLDAHPDLHTPKTTKSGNLHGTPVAYFTGQKGFDAPFPAMQTPIPGENICMLGIRSVDGPEKQSIDELHIDVHDMRAIDESGVKAPLEAFLHRVRTQNGALHVSLDVDFLDPAIAPAVGTCVPGGATFREAHLIMEMLCDSGLVSSLDLVELNPFLDNRGQTALLMVDLCASLLGRTVLDRPAANFDTGVRK